VLGVDPELVLVLALNGQLDPEKTVEPSGLNLLEIKDDQAIVAFASDPELTEFRRRCEEYSKGPPRPGSEMEGSAPYEKLFDSIDAIRELRPEDVLTTPLAERLSRFDAFRQVLLLRLDVQCWCPEDESAARRRHEEAKKAIMAAGGRVLDASLRVRVGLSLLRAEMPSDQVRSLAEVDRIRRIDLLPRPQLSHPHVRSAGPDDLPPVGGPVPGAPVLAVIDSGVRSAHPLLAPSVIGVETLVPGLPDDGDECGHGTFVASLAMYGELEGLLTDRKPLRSAGRLLSLKVLNEHMEFPDDRLWEEHLLGALARAAEAGARVINLSLGDPRRPYCPPRPTPLAAAVDAFIREHDLIVVVCTGNYASVTYDGGDGPPHDYPLRVLADESAGLLDPASAALALTVGALCADEHQGARPVRDHVSVCPLGRPGEPSPVTRRGPGVMHMIKPELTAPGGSFSWDDELRRCVDDVTLHVIGAGGAQPEHLLAVGTGTSYAAPLVSHAALRVYARYPELSANAVRALVLASVVSLPAVISGEQGANANVKRKQRQLTGYGRVSEERAEASTDHRAVLVAEDELPADGVHLYRVPIPSTFFVSRGQRSFTATLAYDPPARPTRLHYLASRMEVRAFLGVSMETVADAYAVQMKTPEEIADLPDSSVPTPASIRNYEIKLDPSDRSRGAHQLGIKIFKKPVTQSKGQEIVLVVRNINRWDTPEARQRYAVAVILERDEDRPPLYSELRAQLEVLAEARLEIE